MNWKWKFVFISILLVFSLAACTGAAGSEPSPTADTDIDLEQEQGADTDVDTGSDSDADTDVDTGSDSDDDTDSDMEEIDAASIYSQRCAGCHGDDREGKNGPPLLPGSLTQDSSVYINTITNGSGPMPAWDSRLSESEISAMVDYILSGAE